jgi:hypothetical protein
MQIRQLKSSFRSRVGADLCERLAQDDLVPLLDEVPGRKRVTDEVARCEALVSLF